MLFAVRLKLRKDIVGDPMINKIGKSSVEQSAKFIENKYLLVIDLLMHKVFWYAPYPDKSIKFYKAKDSKDSGFVLVSTILTLVILFLLAMVVLTLAQQQAKTAVFMRDRNAAFYLAESGIHRAIYEISQIENIAGPLTISSDDSLFQDGSSFTVTINPSESGVYMITSTVLRTE